jgi:hypothetical protein
MSVDLDAALNRATAEAIAASAATAAKLCLVGDLAGAERAIERAEQRYAELGQKLPWHSRLVRQSRATIDMAKKATHSPKRAENEETGLVEPVRERAARRAERAASRSRLA